MARKAVITPAARQYAKSHGLQQAVTAAQDAVWQTIPSPGGIQIDLLEDPDEGGYPTIHFQISIRESVGVAMKLYYALREKVRDLAPAKHRIHLSFSFRFEQS